MIDTPNIPRSWEELKELREYLSDCSPTFLRSPSDKLFYELFRELVPREVALEIIKRQIREEEIALVKNNFPYTNVLQHLPEVAHYCLWSKIGALNEEEIKQQVDTAYPNSMWFSSERKVSHKSVPEIWHCHIFIKG